MNLDRLKFCLVIIQFVAIYFDEIQPTHDASLPIDHLDFKDFKVFSPEGNSNKLGEPPVPIIVYKRSDSHNSMDAMTVEFGISDKVVIYIHGYATRHLEDGTKIKNALFQGTEDVDFVALVDWRKWSLPTSMSWLIFPWNYKIVAKQNVPRVAEKVGHFLRTKLTNEHFIYLVGHSLGAHIAGTAARTVATNGLFVDRITGIDPAGPIFEHRLNILFRIFNKNTLRSTDAKFVDVIHTSTQLGMVKPAGHLDTYLVQNQCLLSTCKHSKAVQLYISSLTRCSLISCPQSGSCTSKTVSDFGYLADRYEGRGKHTLTMKTKKWWRLKGWKDKQCSEFMSVYLPAKYRICHQPPNNVINSVTNCKGKPYLTECKIMCPCNSQNTMSVCSVNQNVRLSIAARSGHINKIIMHVNWFGGSCA